MIVNISNTAGWERTQFGPSSSVVEPTVGLTEGLPAAFQFPEWKRPDVVVSMLSLSSSFALMHRKSRKLISGPPH